MQIKVFMKLVLAIQLDTPALYPLKPLLKVVSNFRNMLFANCPNPNTPYPEGNTPFFQKSPFFKKKFGGFILTSPVVSGRHCRHLRVYFFSISRPKTGHT
jgi:hypothetical protein